MTAIIGVQTADGVELREATAQDDEHAYNVERAGRLTLRAESGPLAKELFPCDTCGIPSRGDMTVFLDADREDGYCDACWTALRRAGRIVDGVLVDEE